MSGYIICPNPSGYVDPAANRATVMHNFHRPLHTSRHRPTDRRNIHRHLNFSALPVQPSPSAAIHTRSYHHRSGSYGHVPVAAFHQHQIGDGTDYHFIRRHGPPQFFTVWNVMNQPGILRLHEEIVAFYKDMRPRPEERQMRDDVVCRITDAIQKCWPATRVEVFGSMKTGLYLPTSDIDLVVFHNWDRTPFFEIRDELIACGICTERAVKVLDNASVPIIKLTDQLTQVKVDIGFNIANSQRSADLVQCYIQQFPALPYLVIVLKQFLYQQELNEVYSGGISSYSLILLTISFLQSRTAFGNNYGMLLLEFFDLYSHLFLYPRVVVSIARGCWQDVKPWIDGNRQPSLSIEDPLCAENDVARGSYNVSRVQAAFAGALRELLSEIFRPMHVCPSPKGMLASIVRVPAEIERYRSWVQARFPVIPAGSMSALSVGREPCAVSSRSSGISSASPGARMSTSCSDSFVSSDAESDDDRIVLQFEPSSSMHHTDATAEESQLSRENADTDSCQQRQWSASGLSNSHLDPGLIAEANACPSNDLAATTYSSSLNVQQTTGLGSSPQSTTPNTATNSFPVIACSAISDESVSPLSYLNSDDAEDSEHVSKQYDGNLFVSCSYKDNPLAYSDISISNLQSAVELTSSVCDSFNDLKLTVNVETVDGRVVKPVTTACVGGEKVDPDCACGSTDKASRCAVCSPDAADTRSWPNACCGVSYTSVTTCSSGTKTNEIAVGTSASCCCGEPMLDTNKTVAGANCVEEVVLRCCNPEHVGDISAEFVKCAATRSNIHHSSSSKKSDCPVAGCSASPSDSLNDSLSNNNNAVLTDDTSSIVVEAADSAAVYSPCEVCDNPAIHAMRCNYSLLAVPLSSDCQNA